MKTMKVIEFNQCPRSVHRELRNRFFDWFHQIEKLEHKSHYYGKRNKDISLILQDPLQVQLIIVIQLFPICSIILI